jgi:predicted phage terminase large subunit-like protein
MLPPQHGKTRSVSVPYPVWRMMNRDGLRAGVCSHSQRYANKISRWCRKLAEKAGAKLGDVSRADEWEMASGSTFIARGRGASIAGEPLDLLIVDDVFGNRQDADSPVVQEEAYEWYMDDVTPRLQKDAAIVLVNTRWGPGDLYGRIGQSEEGHEWDILRLPAIAEENDPLGRKPGEALCPDRFPLEKLLQKRRVEGVGFESLYQGNPIPRGGTFFERAWFEVVDSLPPNARLVRYWDLASSRHDSACFTSGVLMAKVGDGEAAVYYVVDVIRGRWMPADRNDVMLTTARADSARPGFQRTYFESPVFDKDRAAARAIVAKLSGYPVQADDVSGSGSKELRAEPLAGVAKARLVKLVAGSWNAAYLTEMESFPRGQYKDQVDSSSGCYNKLTRGEVLWSIA